MPAIAVACAGFVAGRVAGLLLAGGPLVAALAGAAALVWWRRADPRGVLLLGAAAGALWGALARPLRAGDCRLAWRDGERVAAVVEPRERPAAPSPVRRFMLVSPEECAGPVLVLLPHPDTLAATRIVVGTWRRDPDFGSSLLPSPPERAGRIVARSARPIAAPPGLRAGLRLAAEAKLLALYGAARWPLAAALTLRAEGALAPEVRREFARAGLAHILAISGLHVAILAGAIMLMLRALRCPPARARLAATIATFGYVWLLGAPAPALRAALMLALWCWAYLRQRPPAPGALLAAALLAIVAFDPWTVFEAGLWLSFAGVVGCAVAARAFARAVRESRASARRLRWLAPLAVSAGAVLATTPVQLVGFGTASPIAIASNLIAIPITTLTVPALALSLGLASLPGSLPASCAAVAAAASAPLLDLLEHLAGAAAGIEWGTITPEEPLAAAALSLGLAIWILRPLPRLRPVRDVLAARGLLALGSALVFAAWTPLLHWPVGADGGGRLALHFLAVGQGDAAAIRTPHGSWIVIDAGVRAAGMDQGARKVVPFLRRHGARRLAVVIASHGDADHLGGLPAVLEALPADVALEPGVVLGRPLYVEWLSDVAKDHARWHAARAGDRILVDGVSLRVWHPDSATIAQGWDVNENAVVLTVEYGAFRALFGGDAGLPMEALRAAQIGRVTVLKVGHHGSAGASGPTWLAALRPSVCVIEVGRNNYGHPDAGVVRRLGEGGCRVYRTDQDGDVDVTTDGHAVRVGASGRDTSFIASKEQP
ncbi:MAG: DNA internalization-related competence protein ComEC/Rec2 [Gemmatimonadales bacterium]